MASQGYDDLRNCGIWFCSYQKATAERAAYPASSARFIFEPESNSVATLLEAIFSRNQYWDHPQAPPGGLFMSSGAYLSLIAAAMATIGLLGATRRALPWLTCTIFLFLLAMGSPKPWFPWALLRHLPVYSSMRIPSISLLDRLHPHGRNVGRFWSRCSG